MANPTRDELEQFKMAQMKAQQIDQRRMHLEREIQANQRDIRATELTLEQLNEIGTGHRLFTQHGHAYFFTPMTMVKQMADSRIAKANMEIQRDGRNLASTEKLFRDQVSVIQDFVNRYSN